MTTKTLFRAVLLSLILHSCSKSISDFDEGQYYLYAPESPNRYVKFYEMKKWNDTAFFTTEERIEEFKNKENEVIYWQDEKNEIKIPLQKKSKYLFSTTYRWGYPLGVKDFTNINFDNQYQYEIINDEIVFFDNRGNKEGLLSQTRYEDYAWK